MIAGSCEPASLGADEKEVLVERRYGVESRPNAYHLEAHMEAHPGSAPHLTGYPKGGIFYSVSKLGIPG